MTNFDVIISLNANQYVNAMPELNYKRGVYGLSAFIDWLDEELDEKFWFDTCAILKLDKEKYDGQKS
jgi:hypothetical protein